MIEQDGSIITNPKVWKASGHIDTFGDLLLTTKDTKTKLRADHFIEDELGIAADGMSAEEITNIIKEKNLKYNGEEFQEIKMFRGMFDTQVGADVTKDATAYLRPETAGSIFPNFKLFAETSRQKLPFGIVQIGKAFRNEISPRDFVFRCREFEQIEMEYFFNPEVEFVVPTNILDTKFKFWSAINQDNSNETMEEINISVLIERDLIKPIHAYWLGTMFNWLNYTVGISWENLRIREHVKTELSHYSCGTFDIDYKYPFGFKEMLGMANRGNYDLTQHQTHSKTKLQIRDDASNSNVVPSVIEPSLGVERFLMATIYEAYNDDKERGNVVLNFKPAVSPTKVAVYPLMNKPELVSVAREIYTDLVDEEIETVYDKSGSIGKRYARADEVGTCFCITIDYETLEDGENKGTVTIRDRDTASQKRIDVETASGILVSLLKGKICFSDL